MMQSVQKISSKISKLKTQHQILLLTAILIVSYSIYLAGCFYMDYIELREISTNYTQILTNNIYTRGLVLVAIFVAVYLVMFIQNRIIIRILKKFSKEEGIELNKKLPNKSIALPVAFFIAMSQSGVIYDKLMLYINSVSFTSTDPIFNNNIGFYVFQRPLIMQSFSSLSLVLILVMLYTLGYYITMFGSIFNGVRPKSLFKTGFVSHNIINVMFVVIVKIVELIYKKQDILFSRFMNNKLDIVKQLIGSGWTESNILLNMYRILPVLAVILVIMLLTYYKKREYKKMIKPILLFPCIWIATYVIMISVQLIYVKPNELALESKYIGYNLDMTKEGYNIKNVETKNVEISTDLTRDDVYTSTNIANNIDTVIPDALLTTLNNELSDTNYYTYKDIDMMVDKTSGKSVLSYVIPKEVNNDKTKQQSYINRRFKYTHGYGVAILQNNMNASIQSTDSTTSSTQNILQDSNKVSAVTQPRIYYGEGKHDYVIVNSSSIYELDYTKGSKELIENQYSGKSGINMTTYNKILMGLRKLDPQIIFSNYVDKNSKMLINRNVVDRAEKVYPFLLLEEDPYMTIANDGRLVWVIDGYTKTDSYPYSEYTTLTVGETKRAVNINYIRNSVKILVDAYDGTTNAYITDNTDPIILCYNKMYPNLFTNIENNVMYNSVKDQFKYPQKLFDIQTNIMNQYYTEHTETFYRNDSLLAVPNYLGDNSKLEQMNSFYAVTKLQGMATDDLALLQPYTMAGKDNLKGYFAGTTTNGKNTLQRFDFENDDKVLGSLKLDELMSNNKELQLELKQLSDTRNEVTKKEVLLPFENKILYAQLYYSKPIDNKDSSPSLQVIVLSDGKNIAVSKSNNFKEAFDILFSNKDSNNSVTVPENILGSNNISVSIKATLQAFQDMKNSATQGQWEVFGRDLTRLEVELNKLKEQNVIFEKQQSTVTTTTGITTEVKKTQ